MSDGVHGAQRELRPPLHAQVPQRKAELPKQAAIPADKITLSPTTDMSLDDRLKALDAIHAKAFYEKGRGKEGGVEVATFTRK